MPPPSHGHAAAPTGRRRRVSVVRRAPEIRRGAAGGQQEPCPPDSPRRRTRAAPTGEPPAPRRRAPAGGRERPGGRRRGPAQPPGATRATGATPGNYSELVFSFSAQISCCRLLCLGTRQVMDFPIGGVGLTRGQYQPCTSRIRRHFVPSAPWFSAHCRSQPGSALLGWLWASKCSPADEHGVACVGERPNPSFARAIPAGIFGRSWMGVSFSDGLPAGRALLNTSTLRHPVWIPAEIVRHAFTQRSGLESSKADAAPRSGRRKSGGKAAERVPLIRKRTAVEGRRHHLGGWRALTIVMVHMEPPAAQPRGTAVPAVASTPLLLQSSPVVASLLPLLLSLLLLLLLLSP